ncbi:unnamed protein product [Rotaria sordida]|uniref:Uncharacterized protein n=1 Tax=Rotaria sordida TaxID=392033 RepID=A0A819Z4V5_9BILA|nr:unnamed protein product [Rotaria sordida]
MKRYNRINQVASYRLLLKLFNGNSVAGRNILDEACQNYPSKSCFMAIEPEFFHLIERRIRPITNNVNQQHTTNPTTSSTNDIKSIQLGNDDDNLR